MHLCAHTRSPRLKRVLLIMTLISLGAVTEPVRARTRAGAVRVTVGEPSVWSLEQAHYLLERLRNKNGRIESAPFTRTDPNAVNSTRLDAMRRIFGLSAEFDQTVGLKNRLLAGQYETNLAMRTALESQWHELLKEQGKVDAALHLARIELARLGSAASAVEDRQVKGAEIAALEKNKAEIEARLSTLQAAMGAAGVTPNYTKPGAGGELPALPDSIDQSVIKSALKRAADHIPSLDASTALDSHIQFNYELISKQLTLLRDEVGPGRRILFLELPQTVLGVPSKGDDHLAQSWWRVTGVVHGRLKDDEKGDITKRLPGALEPALWRKAKQNGVVGGDDVPESNEYRTWKYIRYEPVGRKGDEPGLVGPVRSVELIPRISTLNIAESHSAVKASAFSVIGTFLWGLGAQMKYQKQRETFEQFLQQEVYASGHGKGLSEFGWIFGPKPGSKVVAPGVRTTYAVLVVPDDAVYLELAGRGCQYHRKTTPLAIYPDTSAFEVYRRTDDVECGVETTFRVQVPPVEEGFSINEIDYMPVTTGERMTVILRGSDISPQISVMVDGIPLTKVLALGSPKQWMDEFAENNESIRGQLEYLSSSELAFTFSMPTGYVGTPKITLVTPTKAYTLNRLRFQKIAGCSAAARPDCPCFSRGGMSLLEFTRHPSRTFFLPALSISKVESISFDRSTGKIGLAITGRKIDDKVLWLLNASKAACQATSITVVSARLDCQRPESYTWIVGATGHDPDTPEIDSYSVHDPFPPVIEKSEVLEAKEEVVSDKDPAKNRPATAKILFTGKFFNAKQVWKLAGEGEITELDFRSSKQVAVSISSKKLAPRVEFLVAGTAKDPVEQCFVNIREAK